MSEGWVCPKCGRALSPWTSECPCYMNRCSYGSNNGGIYDNKTINIPEPKTHSDYINLLKNETK